MDIKQIIQATTQGGSSLQTQRANRVNLLDAPDLNLGSYATIPAANRNNIPEVSKLTRMLDLSCDSKKSRSAVITLASSTQRGFPVSASNPSYFVGGPLTGYIEFGNGSAISRIEFDIQMPSMTPSTILSPQYQLLPPIGAVSIPVCGSSIRVYVRNDATLPLITEPTKTVGYYINTPAITTLEPEISAFVGYGNSLRGNAHITKTIHVGRLEANNPGQTYPPSAHIGIPAYSKFIRVMGDTTTPVTYLIAFAGCLQPGYNPTKSGILSNDWSAIPVPQNATYVFISNTTAQISYTTCMFDLSI